MSRHRNVRSMNYSEEYDGYDDVYGHSVEDDYSISPSDAAFMYDRNRQPQMSAFLAEEDDIAEEDETEGLEQRHSKSRPILSDTDEARLRSCLEEIRNVIGDTVSESVVIDTILRHDFDLRKALDAVLAAATQTHSGNNEGRRQGDRPKEIGSNTDDSSKSLHFLSSSMNCSDVSVTSLRDDISHLTIKPMTSDLNTCLVGTELPQNSSSSLLTLAQTHIDRKPEEIKKTLFKKRIVYHESSSDEDDDSLASLSSLAARHHKSTAEKSCSEFNSLADLANHHLKSKPNLTDPNKNIRSLSEHVQSHLSVGSQSQTDATGTSLEEIALKHIDKTSREAKNRFVIPPLGFGSKTIPSIKEHIDGFDFENKEDEDNFSQGIDLSVALKPAGSRRQHNAEMESHLDPYVMDLDECSVELPPAPVNMSLVEFFLESDAYHIVTGMNTVVPSQLPSEVGLTLCHRWPVSQGETFVQPARETGNLVPFKFDTPSPDDLILQALRKKWPT